MTLSLVDAGTSLMAHPTIAQHARAARYETARPGAPKLRQRIASAVRGQESLSWAFWTLTVAGSTLLTALLAYAAGLLVPVLLAANRVGAVSSLLPYQSIAAVYQSVWLTFAALCAVAVWRCSKNVSQRHWTYLSCAAALAWLAWNAYGLVVAFAPSLAGLNVPGAAYLGWPIVAIVASVVVTKARGGATFASILVLALLFIGAALAPFVAAALYLGGPKVFTSAEALAQAGGWGILIAMFYFAPSMAVATLSCFTYALCDKSAPRLGYASLVFALLSAGILVMAASQRNFT